MKVKEIKNLSKSDREKKLGELKMELIKSKTGTSKTGNSKKRQIKKIMARMLTLNKAESKLSEVGEKK